MNEDVIVVLTRQDPALGCFALRPVDPLRDAPLLHRWLTHPKSEYWLMQDADLAQVEQEHVRIAGSGHHEAFVGLHEGKPTFLVERYDPARSELAGCYAVRSGDVGMHFLTAPTDEPVHGFTLAVIVTVMEWLFADPHTRRVIVEPDVRNSAVHRLNAAVGFQIERTIALADKSAYLSTCTRSRYRAAVASIALGNAEDHTLESST